jgi:hypothetical protein
LGGLVVLTGLNADEKVMPDKVCESLARLKEKCTVHLSDSGEQRFAAWERAHGEALRVNAQNVPLSHDEVIAMAEKAPAIPHEAAADFAAEVKKDPLGVLHEVKPDFADKYSLGQREGITNYLNIKIKERNELLSLIKEYQNKYGDRSEQLNSFRRLIENHVTEENLKLADTLKGLTDPDQDFSRGQVRGTGDVMAMVRANAMHTAANFADKAGLVLPGEHLGNSVDELASRVAAHSTPKMVAAGEMNNIPPAGTLRPEISHEQVETASDGHQTEVFASGEMRGYTGEENLNMDVVNKLHLTPLQMEALKVESNNLALLENQAIKNGPGSPQNDQILETIKAIIRSGNDKLNHGGADNIFSQNLLDTIKQIGSSDAASTVEAAAPVTE